MPAKLKPEWLKFIVQFKQKMPLEVFNEMVWDAARDLARYGTNIFFARYTNLTDRRAEYQVLVDLPGAPYTLHHLETCTENILAPYGVVHVRIENTAGSLPHARAFDLAHALRSAKADDKLLMDVVHWLFNMCGKHYGQEAILCLRRGLDITEGWVAAAKEVCKPDKKPKRAKTQKTTNKRSSRVKRLRRVKEPTRSKLKRLRSKSPAK
jgi:hypothetical protein